MFGEVREGEEMIGAGKYPDGAWNKIEQKIEMKMYDYYKQANAGKDSYIAMEYLGKRYSYGVVNREIERYAKALKAYGILPGDYVSVLLPNIPEFIFCVMAINRVGAISNLIDPRYNPNTILELVEKSDSKLVICLSNKYDAGIKPIRDQLTVTDVFTVSPFESISFLELFVNNVGWKGLAVCGACAADKFRILIHGKESKRKREKEPRDIQQLLKYGEEYKGEVDAPYVKNAPATILYTSGTTGGALKGAVHSNESYNALHAELEYAFPEERPGMVISAFIPMFLSYGIGVCMFNSLVAGFELKMHPLFKPKELVKLIEHDRPNIVVGVPKFFQTMADSKKEFDYIDHIIIGGDKLLPQKVLDFRKRFPKARIAVGYGETEFLGVVSVTLNNEERPDSSGIPLPAIKLRVLDHETREEVPVGAEGEAYITGLTQMLEYHKAPDETEKITFYDDITGEKFLATGDIVKTMPTGEIIFADRIKRLMKHPDGHQVNADTIEKAISTVKGTKEVCVVGLQYKNTHGVVPTAFVVIDEEATPKAMVTEYERVSVEKIASFRDKALAYVFLKKMPYTPNGKIDAVRLAGQRLEEISDAFIVDDSFRD